MLSLAAPPKSCRHHDTLSSNHLGAEVGVLRLVLWVRGIEKPRVLFYPFFCHPWIFFFKVGLRGIIIIDFCFPEAATSTSMWPGWDHRKSTQAHCCRGPMMHYTVVHIMTNALCQHSCLFAFLALYLLPRFWLGFLVTQSSNVSSSSKPNVLVGQAHLLLSAPRSPPSLWGPSTIVLQRRLRRLKE